MILEIVPMMNVGPIVFGASKGEVRAIWGTVVREFYKGASKYPADSFRELGTHVFYDGAERCVGVEVFSDSSLRPRIWGIFPFETTYPALLRAYRRHGTVETDGAGFYDDSNHLGVFAPKVERGTRKVLSVYIGSATDMDC